MFFSSRHSDDPAVGGNRRRSRLGTAAAVLAAAVGAMVVPLAFSGTASAASANPVVSNEPDLVDVAFDPSGNMWVSERNGAIKVLPTSSGTIFGQSVTAGQLTTMFTGANVPGIVFDAAGDLYYTDTTDGTVMVVAQSSGTIFGTPVTADTPTALATGLDTPVGLAFDSAGNLYIATQTGVSVLAVSSGTLFGQTVTADEVTTLMSGLGKGVFVALDSAGNLYVSDFVNGTVSVLAASTGSVFGQPVTQNEVTTLLSGLSDAAGLAFDPAGDLFINSYGEVDVLPVSSGTIFGTPVTADTLTDGVAVGLLGDLGSTYANGALYVADQLNESVDEIGTPTATISSVTFAGSEANPVVIADGTGFDTSPAVQPDACGPGYSGANYPYGNLFLWDVTQQWGAAETGDCVGANVAELTSSTEVFSLGDGYTSGNYHLAPGDSYQLWIDGQVYSGTVAYSAPGTATVTAVTPASGPGAGGTLTVAGSGFEGAQAVFVGDQPVGTFTVNARGTSIRTTAPAEPAGTVDVTVLTASGLSATSAGDQYTYIGPAITSVTPASGPGNGGTVVTIKGTDLQGTSSVTFGDSPATSFSVNGTGTVIRATAPTEAAGMVTLTVTTPGGTATSSYTYLGPSITSVTPASGPGNGGNTVKIRGTDLQGTSSVTFGDTPAASFTVNTAGTLIKAVAPTEGAGMVTLTVTTPGGSASSSYTFLAPVITHVLPTSGPGAGGNTVTIEGTDFQGTSSVTFGDMPAASFTVNTAGTVIKAVAPPEAAGLVTVTVTTPGGSATGSYTYLAPRVTRITPARGSSAGGTTVTISGADLQGATASSVLFGANEAASASVNATGTAITVTTPAGTGTVGVTVTTPGGTSSPVNFTYT